MGEHVSDMSNDISIICNRKKVTKLRDFKIYISPLVQWRAPRYVRMIHTGVKMYLSPTYMVRVQTDQYKMQESIKQLLWWWTNDKMYQQCANDSHASRNDDYDESIVTLLSTGASIVKVSKKTFTIIVIRSRHRLL